MLKTITALFVLGLALGLWIGFNPQAHEKAARSWAEVHASFLTVKAGVSDAMHNEAVSLKSSGQTGSQWMAVVWKQASSIIATIWDDVRRTWLEITSRLRLKS